jgi:hypothetical protein
MAAGRDLGRGALDHPEAGGAMRSRGQGLLTLLVVAAIAVGAVAFDRLGTREASGAAAGTASSAAWLCPHGGGEAYEATVFLANPGEAEVSARVTQLSADGPSGTSMVAVPAGSQVAVPVDASDRSSSTFVETFGGWVAAGWLVRGAEGEVGIGAEPCAADARREWVSAAATTDQGDDAFLVVMNPFDVDAVFDVALFAAGRAPIRDSELTDVTLRPRRSVAIRLNDYVKGEPALGTSIEVSTGRLAASSLVVSEGRGIASVLASEMPADRHLLPTSKAAGRSALAVAVPTVAPGGGPEGPLGSVLTATLRSEGPPQPAGGLSEFAQDPESAAAFGVTTTGPSAVDLTVSEGSPVVAALRTAGVGNDGAATAGARAASEEWVVLPTIAGEPARPGLLVLNPGRSEATVVVTAIPSGGQSAAATTTITVPPGSVAGVPREFLDGVGDASLRVVSVGSPVVAVGASTSLGNDGLSVYALAIGVPIGDQGTR